MPPLLLLLPLSPSQLDPSQQHFNMLRSLPNQNKSRTKLPCLAAIPLSVLLTARFVGSAAYTFRLCSPMSPLAPQTIRFGFRPISLQDGLTPTLCPLNTAPPHFSLHRQLCNSLWLTKAPPHPHFLLLAPRSFPVSTKRARNFPCLSATRTQKHIRHQDVYLWVFF